MFMYKLYNMNVRGKQYERNYCSQLGRATRGYF